MYRRQPHDSIAADSGRSLRVVEGRPRSLRRCGADQPALQKIRVQLNTIAASRGFPSPRWR